MWWIVAVVTLLILVPVASVTSLIAMVAANGYMGNTDPLVASYLACQCGGLLILSLLSGFLAKKFQERFALSLWLTGAISVVLAVVAQLGVSILAFILAITFFAP